MEETERCMGSCALEKAVSGFREVKCGQLREAEIVCRL